MAALYCYSLVIFVCLLSGFEQTGAQVAINNPYIIQNYLREVLPFAEKTECQKHLSTLFTNYTDNWALKMWDASSKLPTGLLSGNLDDLGAFDQCMGIDHLFKGGHFQGNYCKIKVGLESFKGLVPMDIVKKRDELRSAVNMVMGDLSLHLALCVPSTCKMSELSEIFKINLTSSKIGETLKINVINCQSNEDKDFFTPGDWIASFTMCIVLALMLLSTGYDLYITAIEEKPAHILLKAFSVYTNGKKLFTITKNSSQLSCLHGIRFLSMVWVILGHRFYVSFQSPIINAVEIISWMEKWGNMYILSATLSVDTFFVLGGLLMSYVYLSAKKNGVKFNIFMYYLHRYIRLTPPLAMVLLFHVTIARFIGTGPYWPETVSYLQGRCSTYWWSTLLYIQNIVNLREMCIEQSWYLSVDMQLFIVSPLILIPLGIWPQYTIPGLFLLAIGGVISPFVTAWVYEIPGFVAHSFTNSGFVNYYFETYTRFGPMVIGLILGYYIFTRRENLKLNALLKNSYINFIGMLAAVLILGVIIFAPNNMQFHEYSKIESSIYLGFHRTAWAIALSWIIYTCVIERGGWINAFLSLSVFQILGRLTYSMYLLHITVQMINIGRSRTAMSFGNLENIYSFWGDFATTICLAICWTLAFESPMLIIEKLLFRKFTTKKTPVDRGENRQAPNV